MVAGKVISDVQKLKQGLKVLPEPVANPVFVAVSGLPGTGKSYFSRRLAELLPSVIVESDALRRILFPSPTYSAQESQRLFTACHSLIEELLSGGITVVLDATNLMEQHRERLYRIAQRLKVKLIMIQVEAPRELVQQRLQGRSRGVDAEDNSDADWGVYRKMKASAQRIRRNYFAVDTSRDIAPVIDRIVREAKR
ncbi:MAG TPA: ATP-binding protein [Dehalococcoidia bacterium]|nr:ATP-binding protein [Dehalococcoidia bacterium]